MLKISLLDRHLVHVGKEFHIESFVLIFTHFKHRSLHNFTLPFILNVSEIQFQTKHFKEDLWLVVKVEQSRLRSRGFELSSKIHLD